MRPVRGRSGRPRADAAAPAHVSACREKHWGFIYTCNVLSPSSPPTTEREEAVAAISASLVPRASLATRLLVGRSRRRIARSEAGLLAALSAGPRRITELADLEGLAQPTITLIVKRLEQRGWLARERDAADRRAVLVSLTDAGARALDELRADYRGALRGHLDAMSDQQVADLMTATAALGDLIDALQRGEPQ
jgi:DNA-binding MarR family transcriptional regulator